MLVSRVVEAGEHQAWGDVVTIVATTALRISEVAGLRAGDVDMRSIPDVVAWSPRKPRAVVAVRCRSSTRCVRPFSGSRLDGVAMSGWWSVLAAV